MLRVDILQHSDGVGRPFRVLRADDQNARTSELVIRPWKAAASPDAEMSYGLAEGW